MTDEADQWPADHDLPTYLKEEAQRPDPYPIESESMPTFFVPLQPVLTNEAQKITKVWAELFASKTGTDLIKNQPVHTVDDQAMRSDTDLLSVACNHSHVACAFYAYCFSLTRISVGLNELLGDGRPAFGPFAPIVQRPWTSLTFGKGLPSQTYQIAFARDEGRLTFGGSEYWRDSNDHGIESVQVHVRSRLELLEHLTQKLRAGFSNPERRVLHLGNPVLESYHKAWSILACKLLQRADHDHPGKQRIRLF